MKSFDYFFKNYTIGFLKLGDNWAEIHLDSGRFSDLSFVRSMTSSKNCMKPFCQI
jgi:hypothetical protein